MSKTWNVKSLQVKRATSRRWDDLNPTLKAGEIGLDTTTGIFKIGDGDSRWRNLPYFAPRVLETHSWAEINAIAEQGLGAAFFRVGDKKNITLSTGELVTLVILDFNHDTKSGGGTAGITFGMEELLTTAYTMNSSDTNEGGWTSSVMRTSTMPTLLSLLPSELKAYIKPVNKLSVAGGYPTTTINTDVDKLFLLSEIEVFGTNEWSVAGEGTQYAYYRNILEKYAGVNKYGHAHWWLRSPSNQNDSSFCVVDFSGKSDYLAADGTAGIAFNFCI